MVSYFSENKFKTLKIKLFSVRIEGGPNLVCIIHFCHSVAKLYLLFGSPMTAVCLALLFSTDSQSLLKFMYIELVMLSILSSATPFSFCLPSLPASESFPMSQLFASRGQSIGASASESLLPMNIHVWFPFGLTGLISLQSKRLSRVFSNTKFKSINSLALSLLHSPILLMGKLRTREKLLHSVKARL